jgi:hypothetical protein
MNNYRPISVLTSLSKLFEQIVYAQIYEYKIQTDSSESIWFHI